MKGTAVHVLKLQATPTAGPLHARAAYAWSVENFHLCKRIRKKTGIGKALRFFGKALAAQNKTNLNACIASPVVDDEYLNYNSIPVSSASGYSSGRKFQANALTSSGRWYNMVWMEKIIADHPQTAPM